MGLLGKVSTALPVDVRNSVDDFQLYVWRMYSERATSWPEARTLIQAVAGRLGRRAYQEHLGVDLAAVAEVLRVSVKWGKVREEKARGLMIPTSEGFEVTLGGRLRSAQRVRFAIAHEYGHCLFYALDRVPPARIIPRGAARQALYKREEGLCDSFAAALLIPEEIGSHIADEPVSLATVAREAERLRVSMEVLLRRLLSELGVWPEWAFYRVLLNGAESSPRVRAFYGVRVREVKSLPSEKKVQEALENGGAKENFRVLCSLLPGARLSRTRGALWAAVKASSSEGMI